MTSDSLPFPLRLLVSAALAVAILLEPFVVSVALAISETLSAAASLAAKALFAGDFAASWAPALKVAAPLAAAAADKEAAPLAAPAPAAVEFAAVAGGGAALARIPCPVASTCFGPSAPTED